MSALLQLFAFFKKYSNKVCQVLPYFWNMTNLYLCSVLNSADFIFFIFQGVRNWIFAAFTVRDFCLNSGLVWQENVVSCSVSVWHCSSIEELKKNDDVSNCR